MSLSQRLRSWIVLATALYVHAMPRASAQDAGEAFFESRIRPILVEHCYPCHSGTKTNGSLALDHRDGTLRGGESGPAIVAGDPDASLLIQAVRRQGLEMPPDRALPADQVELLAEWVRRGAPDPRIAETKLGGMSLEAAKHWWALQSLPHPEPDFGPASIDAAIERQCAAHSLSLSPPADKRPWIRRVTYDLTGLPPTWQQVCEFLADESPEAYAKVVDRLLDSPEYGVHWGRHWLDVVRYADTAGENTDRPLVHAWRYRNWVIDAFQRDLPFDRMIRLQIAGDTFSSEPDSPQRAEGIIATGYLAIARRFGHDIDKDIHLTLEDAIDNIGKSFLGMTVGCARCHDHKYDPVTAQDYYALYGILASSKFSFPGCEPKGQPRDMVPISSPAEIEAIMQPYRERVAAIEAEKQRRAAATEGTRNLWKNLPSPPALLASAHVAEGASVELSSVSPNLENVAVRAGDVLQLSILPNGNHGADTTLVDWTIEEVDGNQRRWSTSQLIDGFLEANPRATACLPDADAPASESTAHWCYFESTDGPAFLNEKRTANGGSDAIASWSLGSEPSAFVNRSESAVNVWTALPARSLFLHPGPNRNVTLAWVSPCDTTVRLRGRVADAHPAALDGAAFKIEHVAAPELGKSLLEMGQLQTAPLDSAGPEPQLPMAYAVVEGTPGNAKLHLRGDPEKPGPEIPRGFLTALGGQSLADPSASGRRELADWIAEHPLTARVMVNRIWQWHFGAGLVRTANDFGSRGEPPTHPELLDQLAAQFVANGYRIKPLHRALLLSRAYRRSCEPTSEALAKDPDNRWWSHFSRRRLSAEEIRDSLLVASDQLDRSPAQGHPFPPESSWTFTQHDPFNAVYETQRRSVYLMVQRQRRHPFLALFDGADPNASTPVRSASTVPTQALYFLNDPAVHRLTQTAVDSLSATTEPALRLTELYHRFLQRDPTAAEMARLQRFLAEYPGPEPERWGAVARILFASNESLYID